jgi:predicted dehydrogenase
MSNRVFNVAVVGCGAQAQSAHLPKIEASERMRLITCCDFSLEVAQKCAEKYGAERAERDWKKVIEDPEIDLIVLVTHTNLRGELIVPALRAGKPVYTEKPLSNSEDEMIEIYRSFRETNVPICVGHNRRSSPAILEFKRLLDRIRDEKLNGWAPSVFRAPERGPIPEESGMQILMRVNDDARSWKPWAFFDKEGILFIEMVHFVDLALWLNHSHPVRVIVEGSPRGNFTVVIRFADGSMTTMQHSLVGHFDYPKELFELSYRNISIALDQHFELRQAGMMDEPAVKYFPFSPKATWAKQQGMAGYMAQMRAEQDAAIREQRPARHLGAIKGHSEHMNRFLDHLEGRGENPAPVESAIFASRVTLKAMQSALLGLPVSIHPQDWSLAELN